MTGRVDAATGRKPFFQRIGRPIGLQLYTLGDQPAHDLDKTLAEVAAIGYRDIELPGLYGRKPAEIRAAADRAGLKVSSLHLAATMRGQPTGLSLDSPTAEVVEGLQALGAARGVLPIMVFPDGMRPRPGETPQAMIARAVGEAGPDFWKRTAALLNERAAALKPSGLRLGYHNHNLEFASVGGTRGWDILLGRVDKGEPQQS